MVCADHEPRIRVSPGREIIIKTRRRLTKCCRDGVEPLGGRFPAKASTPAGDKVCEALRGRVIFDAAAAGLVQGHYAAAFQRRPHGAILLAEPAVREGFGREGVAELA